MRISFHPDSLGSSTFTKVTQILDNYSPIFFILMSQFLPSILMRVQGFPGGSEVKVSACNVGDLGSIPGLGRSPGEGNVNPLQNSCLENTMDGGAWWGTVHGVAKCQTRLSNLTFTFNIPSTMSDINVLSTMKL